jgi:hypothetical protein
LGGLTKYYSDPLITRQSFSFICIKINNHGRKETENIVV